MGRRSTRSQVTLPDEILQIPQFSPMKQARSARNNPSSSHSSLLDAVEDVSEDGLLSPKKSANSPPAISTGKRPASPSSGGTSLIGLPEGGREAKRFKRDVPDEKLNQQLANARSGGSSHTRNLSDSHVIANQRKRRKPTRLQSEKPRSVASDRPLTRHSSLPLGNEGRAKSVPVQWPTSYSYPHIDLTNLPNSPTHSRSRSRSPSKTSTPKMRITPLPPLTLLPSIPDGDVPTMDVDSVIPSPAGPTEPPTEETSSTVQDGQVEPEPEHPNLETDSKVKFSEDVAYQEPTTPAGPNEDRDHVAIWSPLTPLPETPFPLKVAPHAKDTAPTITDVNTVANSKPQPSKPLVTQVDKQQTRLPRPSNALHRSMALERIGPDTKETSTSKPSGSKISVPATKGKGATDAFTLMMDKGKGKKPEAKKTSGMMSKVKSLLSGDKGKAKAVDVGRKVNMTMKERMKGKGKAEPKPAPALVPIPSDEEDMVLGNTPLDQPLEEDDSQLEVVDPVVSSVLPDPVPEVVGPVIAATLLEPTPEVVDPLVAPVPPSPQPESVPMHEVAVKEQYFEPPKQDESDRNPFLAKAAEPQNPVHANLVVGPPSIDIPVDIMEDNEPLTPIEDDAPVEPNAPPGGDEAPEAPSAAVVEKVALEPDAGPSSQKGSNKLAIEGQKRIPSSIPTTGGRVTRSSSNRKPSETQVPGPSKAKQVKQTTLNFSSVGSTAAKRNGIGGGKVTDAPKPGNKPKLTDVPKPDSEPALKPVDKPVNKTKFPKVQKVEKKALAAGSPMKLDDSPARRSPRVITSSKSSPALRTPSSSPAKRKTNHSASPSPTKKVARSASMLSGRPSANLAENRFAKNGSSLSTLANALEQLRMPPPSRPSTSMGFNRDNDDDEEDSPFVSGSKNQSQDDMAVGKKVVGTVQAPGLGRSATLGANHFSRNKDGVVGGGKPSRLGPFGPNRVKGKPLFGVSGVTLVRRGTAKASKNPGLPSVMGSPVKGGAGNGDVSMADEIHGAVDEGNTGGSSLLQKLEGSALDDSDMEPEVVGITEGKGKERASEDYSSRRASMASHFLSQSVAAFRSEASEQASGKGLMGPPSLPSGVKPSGSRNSSGTFLATSASMEDASSKGTPPGRRSTRMAAAAASQAIASVAASSRRAPPVEEKPAADEAIKFLKDCTIFVDVKTEDGDEAGSLFIQMLEVAGARILQRVGQSCTHIIYKNGLQSTINRYRLLRDPKPLVVGIAWVVDCVEQRKKVGETDHLIDLEETSLFSNPSKRRRSMLPKLISRETSDYSSHSEMNREEFNNGDISMDGSSPSLVIDMDDLPPLERARRRKSILPTPTV